MRWLPERVGRRREFFRDGARYTLLAGLGVLAAIMSKRRLGGQRCVNRGICRSCGVFETCGLPQALSAKQTISKG